MATSGSQGHHKVQVQLGADSLDVAEQHHRPMHRSAVDGTITVVHLNTIIDPLCLCQQAMPVRPGELLPSVLRTSADLAPSFSMPQPTATGKRLDLIDAAALYLWQRHANERAGTHVTFLQGQQLQLLQEGQSQADG
jgi:hypothetical protein